MQRPPHDYNARMLPATCRNARRLARTAAAAALLALLAACGDGAAASPQLEPIPLALPLKDLPQPPWMDYATAKTVFPALAQESSRMVFDPLALVLLRPDEAYTFPWPESAAGRISFKTNNRGFREDEPTKVEKHGRRILVLGDSQTEGVVENRESFANVLEALLAERGAPAEVINAGIGVTGPHNYLGVLLKQLELKPDLVVVMIYDGNDFAHGLQVDDVLHGRSPTPVPRAALDAAKNRWPGPIPQAFTQAAVFKTDATLAGRALTAVYVACAELARQADAIGARVLFVALPTKPDIDDDDDERQAEIVAALGLTRDDLEINSRMGSRLLAELARGGRETLDLLPKLREVEGPLYWTQDYHLNVAGHAAVARALLETVGTTD
jgi:lysophospholipase L1-like esterase